MAAVTGKRTRENILYIICSLISMGRVWNVGVSTGFVCVCYMMGESKRCSLKLNKYDRLMISRNLPRGSSERRSKNQDGTNPDQSLVMMRWRGYNMMRSVAIRLPPPPKTKKMCLIVLTRQTLFFGIWKRCFLPFCVQSIPTDPNFENSWKIVFGCCCNSDIVTFWQFLNI